MKKPPSKTAKPSAKQRKPRIDHSPAAFETAFRQKIGVSPAEWIKAKIENGSIKDDVKYYFGVCATAIAAESNCEPQEFERYYNPAWKKTVPFSMPKKEVKPMSPKEPKVYNKLVRDRIPEIIEADGKKCACETLSQEQYLAMLDAKLNEELAEYQQSKSLEELADLLEVMGAVVKARGYSWDELTAIRKQKLEKRGGFEKRILLKEVYEGGAAEQDAPQVSHSISQPRNAGKPWTAIEDRKLEDEFDAKMSIALIAQEHGRTHGAIESRLVRLGKIKKSTAVSSKK